MGTETQVVTRWVGTCKSLPISVVLLPFNILGKEDRPFPFLRDVLRTRGWRVRSTGGLPSPVDEVGKIAPVRERGVVPSGSWVKRGSRKDGSRAEDGYGGPVCDTLMSPRYSFCVRDLRSFPWVKWPSGCQISESLIDQSRRWGHSVLIIVHGGSPVRVPPPAPFPLAPTYRRGGRTEGTCLVTGIESEDSTVWREWVRLEDVGSCWARN